jgi:hypothetical protein
MLGPSDTVADEVKGGRRLTVEAELARGRRRRPTEGARRHSVDRCNTPYYDSSNLSLITVISILVMHYTLELINSESSQRDF